VTVTSPGVLGGRIFEINEPNFTQAMCQRLHDDLRAWGNSEESEMVIEAPSLPSLRRGMGLHVTGLLGSDDITPIPTEPAFVYEVDYPHDETTPTPTAMMTVRCGWWKVP
jgi:hypothetical protein